MEEIALLILFSVTLVLVSPLLHEMFHIIALFAVGCPSFNFGYTITASGIASFVEPLCDMSRLQSLIVVLSGICASVVLAEALLLMPAGGGRARRYVAALSSGIVISNALSLAAARNDIETAISMVATIPGELSHAIGVLLGILGAAQFWYIVRKSSHSRGTRARHRR